MKHITKQLDSNFAFALLAIIFTGFLLWHSIAIFTLQQELASLQNQNVVIPVKDSLSADRQEIQKDATQDPQNIESQILYNEDGSIDTSNWKVCEVGALKISCPPDWHVVERGIANVPREELETGLPREEGQIGMFFAGSSDFTSSMQEHLDATSDYYDTCTEMISADLMTYMTCIKKEEKMYIHAFRKVILEKSKTNPNYYSYEDEAASFITKDKDNFGKHEEFVSAIMKELSLSSSGEKFIPSK